MSGTWKGYHGITGNLIYNFDDLQGMRNYSLKIPDRIKSNFFITSTIGETSRVRIYYDEAMVLSNNHLVDQICSDFKFQLNEADYKYVIELNEVNTTRLYYLIKSKILNMDNKEKINAVYSSSTNTDNPLWNATSLDGGVYDEKGNSDHYQKQFMELVREQERKYGTIVAYLFCIGNVDKYAGRAGEKAGVPAEKDLAKKTWYKKAARHFKLKIEAEKNKTVAPDRNAYVSMPEEVKDLICCEQPFSELFNVGYIPLSVAIEK
jgi:hypothetical protein